MEIGENSNNTEKTLGVNRILAVKLDPNTSLAIDLCRLAFFSKLT